jgi:hypothetical protein
MATSNNTETPSFGQLYESVYADLRTIRATAHLIANDTEGNAVVTDAALHLADLARVDLDAMEQLWSTHHKDFEAKREPEAAREEWSPKDLSDELKAISLRIAALPEHGVRELLDFTLNIVGAHNPDQPANQITLEEIDALVKAGIGPKYVHAFWWLKDRGVAQLVPSAKGEAQ